MLDVARADGSDLCRLRDLRCEPDGDHAARLLHPMLVRSVDRGHTEIAADHCDAARKLLHKLIGAAPRHLKQPANSRHTLTDVVVDRRRVVDLVEVNGNHAVGDDDRHAQPKGCGTPDCRIRSSFALISVTPAAVCSSKFCCALSAPIWSA